MGIWFYFLGRPASWGAEIASVPGHKNGVTMLALMPGSPNWPLSGKERKIQKISLYVSSASDQTRTGHCRSSSRSVR